MYSVIGEHTCGSRNIVVDPQKNSSIKHQLAQEFVDFMISAEAQQLIQEYTIEGEQLFFPLRPVKEN
jgi:ABC-type tungstate transport system permease subunit